MDKSKIWYTVPFINSVVTIYYPNSLGNCKVVVPFRPRRPTKQVYGKCTLKIAETGRE